MHRLFLTPLLAVNFAIMLVPALLTALLSLFRWDGLAPASFIGLDNFRSLAADQRFWSALGNNAIWTAIYVVVPNVMALVVAAALLNVRRLSTLLQTVFFLPVILATSIVARVWQGMIYNPQTGIVGVLRNFGFDVPNPLAIPETSLFAVSAVGVWQYWGFLCVIYFAALRQVPAERIEAAHVDGATFRQVFRYVLLPGIRPTIALMLVMTLIWSFKAFDFIYIMTGGGPAFTSDVLSTLAYRDAFFNAEIGRAAASAMVISFLGLSATYLYLRLQVREFA